VLTNGALPRWWVVDAVTRLLPGVLATTKVRATSRSATACWDIRNGRAGGISRNEGAGRFGVRNHAEIEKCGANRQSCGRRSRDPDLLK